MLLSMMKNGEFQYMTTSMFLYTKNSLVMLVGKGMYPPLIFSWLSFSHVGNCLRFLFFRVLYLNSLGQPF